MDRDDFAAGVGCVVKRKVMSEPNREYVRYQELSNSMVMEAIQRLYMPEFMQTDTVTTLVQFPNGKWLVKIERNLMNEMKAVADQQAQSLP